MSKDRRLPLLLMDEKGSKFMVRTSCGMQEIKGIGVVDTDKLAAKHIGSKVDITGKEYVLLEASLLDVLASLKRGPQWIMPKDSAQILVGCGIGPGNHVLEVGTGTGALTMVLAYHVGPEGIVVTYEVNERTARLARNNIKQTGLGDNVEMRVDDAINCNEKATYDAMVMDIPEPWGMLEIATRALKPSGYLCAYVPTMNQVEATIKAMREGGYVDTRAVENLQREIVVGKGGTRPSFDMLGHTGYLCFGRKAHI